MMRYEFSAPMRVSDSSQDGRRFVGTLYGGGVITDHGNWDAVAFDLATVRIATPIPLLFQHRLEQTVGVVRQAAKRDTLQEKVCLRARELDLVGGQLHRGPGRSASKETHDARQRVMLESPRAECDATPKLRQTLWRLYALLRSSQRAWSMRDWNHMMDVLGIAFPDDSAATELAVSIEAQCAGHMAEESVA